MKTLIVIDMQKDFVTNKNVLGSDAAIAIVDNVKKKIEEYRDNHWRIIFTRDTHDPNYMNTHEGKYLPVFHCLKNTDGWSILPELEAAAGDNSIFVDKTNFSYDNWSRYVSLRDEVELIGVCTDICVVSNALALRTLHADLNITVDSNCCAGTSTENHNAALAVMKSCHIDVI